MTDTTPYKERDDFVPDPGGFIGTVDTTGTGGDLAGQVMQSSPVHQLMRDKALAFAAENPDDPNVVLPNDDISRDDALANLRAAVETAKEAAESVEDPYLLTPAQREAAKEGTPVNPYSPEAVREDTLSVDESDGYEAREVEPRESIYGAGIGGGGFRQDESENPNPRQPIDENAGTADEGTTPTVVADSTPTDTSATVVNAESSDGKADVTTDADRPADDAPKSEWEAWAVKNKGLSKNQAKGKSQQELAAL